MKKLLTLLTTILTLLTLTACAKNDNGTYVYERDASEMTSKFDEGEATWRATITINDDKGFISVVYVTDEGEEELISSEAIVDQDRKTITPTSDESTADYEINGKVLTLHLNDPTFDGKEFVKK